MKIDAFKAKDYSFTADLYTFTTQTDSTGNPVYTYTFARSISFAAATGIFGKMTVYLADTESDVRISDQLHKIKDASGAEMQSGFVWQVDQIQPNINTWGRREGFRGRLSFIGLDN